MTNRLLEVPNDPALPQGEQDLSDLKAHKKLHKEAPASLDKLAQERNASLDLAAASISNTDIQRVTPRPNRRTDLTSAALSASPARTTSTAPEQTVSTKPSRDRSKPTGILSNPHYRYSGGPVGRIITFLANILKFIERLFLRAIGALKTTEPTPQPKRPTTSPASNAPGTEQSTKNAALRRKEERKPRLRIRLG